MAADSPDLVIAKRLLDHAKLRGFQFRRVAPGPDGPLLGTRRTGDWEDTLYLAGFSRDCYALRKRTTSLVAPASVLVERRATGDALTVLNAALTWETGGDAQPQQPPPQHPPAGAGGAATGDRPVEAPDSATVDSSRTVSSCPAGQLAGSRDALIGRLTSNVVRHSWQRNS